MRPPWLRFFRPPADPAERAFFSYTFFFSGKKEKGSVGAAKSAAEKD